MGRIILKNISLDERAVDILIEGCRFARIVPAGSDPALTAAAPGTEVVDCTGKAAVPGLINMHTHSAMTLMRGICEDQVLEKWLDSIWEVESRMDADFVYWGTKVACLEMAKTGTTTYNDMYWHTLPSQKAVAETGLRSAVSYVVLDNYDSETSERQKDECLKAYEESRKWAPETSFAASFHSVYTVSEPMILWTADFARRNGLKLHIHLSETSTEVANCKAAHGGLSPVEYLDRLGILDSNVIAAHTLWLSDNDIEILGRRHVNCVHNVNSNLKLASGYRFKYNELRDAGANVCIGTDGCASSNNLDLLEALKTMAFMQKAWREDPTAMPLGELLACATTNCAKALGIESGAIEEGLLADMLIVDTENTFFLSPGSFLANFLYSTHSDSVDSVICNGKFVMRGREFPGEKEILAGAREAMKKII